MEKGKGWIQKQGEAPVEIVPGDVVWIPPDEKHWHGASREEEMIHWAVNLGNKTEWLEEVTHDEYSRLVE